MLYILIIPLLSLFQHASNLAQNPSERKINYRGVDYLTTTEVETRFIGTYKGRKSGFMQLNSDGTGTYIYDVFGLAPATCKKEAIHFEWGFLLNENGEVVKKERDYGYSYPILLKSTSKTSFQGCSSTVMMDYILDKGGTLHVSSSDDWKK